MTLRTITFDDSIYKLVPREPDEEQYIAADKFLDVSDEYGYRHFIQDFTEVDLYKVMIEAAPEYQEPENPLDTPLPCDIRIGAGTIKKGSKLSVLVRRMNVLYQLAMKTQLGIGEPVNQEPTEDE